MGLLMKRCGAYGAWKAEVVLAFLLMSPLGLCAESIIFQEHFENGLGGFTIDNTYGVGYGLWHLSTSCEVSDADNALYYGRDDACDYNFKIANEGVTNQGVVESPPIDLTRHADGPIKLRFKYLDSHKFSCLISC